MLVEIKEILVDIVCDVMDGIMVIGDLVDVGFDDVIGVGFVDVFVVCLCVEWLLSICVCESWVNFVVFFFLFCCDVGVIYGEVLYCWIFYLKLLFI